MSDVEVPVHPVQVKRYRLQEPDVVPEVVALRAYEVYCAVYSPQPAMVTGRCRGGFGISEMVAFLYAHSFPKNEWRARVQEAFKGMRL